MKHEDIFQQLLEELEAERYEGYARIIDEDQADDPNDPDRKYAEGVEAGVRACEAIVHKIAPVLQRLMRAQETTIEAQASSIESLRGTVQALEKSLRLTESLNSYDADKPQG